MPLLAALDAGDGSLAPAAAELAFALAGAAGGVAVTAVDFSTSFSLTLLQGTPAQQSTATAHQAALTSALGASPGRLVVTGLVPAALRVGSPSNGSCTATVVCAAPDAVGAARINSTLTAQLASGALLRALQAGGMPGLRNVSLGVSLAGVQLHLQATVPPSGSVQALMAAATQQALTLAGFNPTLLAMGPVAAWSLSVPATFVAAPPPAPRAPAAPAAVQQQLQLPTAGASVTVQVQLALPAAAFNATWQAFLPTAATLALARLTNVTVTPGRLLVSANVSTLGGGTPSVLTPAAAARVGGPLAVSLGLPSSSWSVMLQPDGSTLTLTLSLPYNTSAASALAIASQLASPWDATWALAALPPGVSVPVQPQAVVVVTLLIDAALPASQQDVANGTAAAALMAALGGIALPPVLAAAGGALRISAVLPPAPACNALSVSSLALNMTVQTCSNWGAADGGLTVGLPGTGVAALLPPEAGAAAAQAALHTIMYAMAFDPHVGATGATAGGVGVTRLSLLSANGSALPLPVQGLSSLVQLELPYLAPPAVGTFWNEQLGAYDQEGLVTMPNPQPPPGDTLIWDPLFNASAQPLALAWMPGGGLGDGCVHQTLNCSDPSQVDQLVSLNPDTSLGRPVAGCGNRTSGLLRLVVGGNCTLWTPASQGCY